MGGHEKKIVSIVSYKSVIEEKKSEKIYCL